GDFERATKRWWFVARRTTHDQLAQLVAEYFPGEEITTEPIAAPQTQTQRPTSKGYVGTVGEIVEVTARVTRDLELDPTQYGPVMMYVLHTFDDRMLLWRSTSAVGFDSLGRGDVVRLRGKVKKHDEYRGEPQTVLTRCRVLERVPAAEVGTVSDTLSPSTATAAKVSKAAPPAKSPTELLAEEVGF